MADLSKAIQEYIDDVIRLDQKDISAAVASREWLLKRIRNTVNSRVEEPQLYAVEEFVYFGSYIKGTKVDNVDEFDVLVVIDSNSGVFSVGGEPVGNGLGTASPNHKYDAKYKKSDDSGVSPRKILNWLQSVVEEAVKEYGGTAPEKDGGQAVVATIDSKDLKIDLVPAGVFRRTADNSIFYNIPNGKKDNGWIVTSPKGDITRLSNGAKDRTNLRNVIRLGKRIKETYGFTVSSFAIETAILDFALSNAWFNVLSSDTTNSLVGLAKAFRSGAITDPYSSSVNLVDGVESLDWYAERLDDICEKLESAGRASTQDDSYTKVVKAFEND